MSVKLDPKEVLHYLNELGYCNISAQQLKEFMRDLKKLMKYDIQKAEKENIPLNKKRLSPQKYETPCSQVDFECARNFKSRTQSPISQKQTTCKDVNYACAERPYVSEPVDVVFSNLHSASTVSSRARYVGQTPNIPGVSFARPRKSSSCGASEGSRLTSFYTECTDESLRPKNTLSNKRPKSAAPYLKRPKSFIKSVPLHPTKSDPVALYHQYQAEWKKQKLPGEDYHKEIRWAIREKMLSGPSIQPISTLSSKSYKRM